MNHFNLELKAKCKNPEEIRKILLENNAEFRGEDHQIDTYYNVKAGRLKIRKGNIENSLIFYNRNDNPSKKESQVILEQSPSNELEKILELSLGKRIVVDKKREIYFIENVKFHIDYVEGLGEFIEIEAISENESIPREKLEKQFNYYKELLKVNEKDLIGKSYSEML